MRKASNLKKDCPSCGNPMNAPYTECGCGWTATGKRSRFKEDPLRNRCAFEMDGKRCRYIGTISHGLLGAGPWFCKGHLRVDFNRTSSRSAALRSIEQSEADVPADFDYSTKHLADLAFEHFFRNVA